MSTQNNDGIEFSILPEENHQHFRLLELPAELLSVVTSSNPPVLQLKSSADPSGDTSAVLCTPDKTFNIRQVNTSNTVFIAKSFDSSGQEDDLPLPVLQAIAQSQSTLEVLPTKDLSAVPYITLALPTYTSTGHYSSNDAITKPQLFANIPLSDAECESGWNELACFELGEGKRCFVPSASVKLKTWESILSEATAKGIDLTQPLDERQQTTLLDLENDWPTELAIAVLQSMAIHPPGRTEIHLDGQTCARNVGRTLLKERTNESKTSLPIAAFKSAWSDLLPEKWRPLAEISLLNGNHSLESDGGGITYVDSSADVLAPSNGKASTDTKSTLGAKRKWHEKFRASKKNS